jgi:DnaJ family protein C protein 13
MLARATNTLLLITGGDGGSRWHDAADAAAETAADDGGGLQGDEEQSEESSNARKRSMWVPADEACPKVWFVAPATCSFPPPLKLQKGPFRVTDLLASLDRGDVTGEDLVAPLISDDPEESGGGYTHVVDTGLWKPMRDYFQLRMQMLFPGKAVYSPAEMSAKFLVMLQRVGGVHRSVNYRGVPFFPIPESKRIISGPEHLVVFAQLLLCNDSQVIANASDLLYSLVEFNALANSKLYLTGAFFFACRHTGNNFLPLARLLHITHLKQSFHDSAESVARDMPIGQRSILGSMLPSALISLLDLYGPERFSTVITGEFDTPEVIWSAEYRRQLVDLINQHLGDFPARLRQFTLAQYDYCPIPKVHYPTLDKELYCHMYYLRNLCDEVRFPDWPVREPLVLLREAIEMWREELSKGVPNSLAGGSREVMGLPEKFSDADLRKAYKNLARKYHPDKNPNGREMFEKIQAAYELLCSIELKVSETDLVNVLLLVKVQNLVYRRYPAAVQQQKYPAYAMLTSVLLVPPAQGPPISGVPADILVEGVKLMYYTCSVSPLNGREFVKSGAVNKLDELIHFAVDALNAPETETQRIAADILVFGMKTLLVITTYDIGCSAIEALCPSLAVDVARVAAYNKRIPVASEYAIQVIAGCSVLPPLQGCFVKAGVLWTLVPLLLAYDSTLVEVLQDEDQRTSYNQHSGNRLAVVSALALGRLAGLMFDELASPDNPRIVAALSALLTGPFVKLLRNKNAKIMLSALNENCETATKIWNVGMRKEVSALQLQL